MNKIYLNLTNGIEMLEKENDIKDIKFVRIQSSICEAKNWDRLIYDLDYNFLLDIALGHNVTIIDASQHKSLSRALYQGVEFIKFVLNKVWLHKDTIPIVNNMKVTQYFTEEYHKLSEVTINKLKYVKKFLNTDEIHISKLGFQTIHDSDYEYYRNILIKKCGNNE